MDINLVIDIGFRLYLRFIKEGYGQEMGLFKELMLSPAVAGDHLMCCG